MPANGRFNDRHRDNRMPNIAAAKPVSTVPDATTTTVLPATFGIVSDHHCSMRSTVSPRRSPPGAAVSPNSLKNVRTAAS